MARRRLRTLLLLVLTALSLPAATSAAEKLDLSPYLAPPIFEGDFRHFLRSTGGTRTVTAIDIAPWRSGVSQVFSTTVSGAGADDGTSLSEIFLIPGRQIYTGDELLPGGIASLVRKPAKDLRLIGSLGKPQRIRRRTALVSNGFLVGGSELVAGWLPEGFQTVSTPSGAYVNCLRAVSVAGIRLQGGSSTAFVYLERTHWYAAGIGLVRLETYREIYDGSATVDAWTEVLSAGKALGIAFP